jgi:LPXTG-motif cell wall-anchored protein
VFGDLLDPENGLVSANTCPAQPPAIAAGGTFSCSFEAFVGGDAGDPDHHDTVTAAASDDEGNPATGSDDATVAFSDSLPSLQVTKTASPSAVGDPGGIVSFSVAVENTSPEPVALISLLDSVFGDLRDAGNLAVWENTCPAQPAEIPEGGTLACSFEALVAGEYGDPDHVDTVTAAAVDDEGNPASAGDAATVGFLATQAVVTGHLFVDLDGDATQGFGEPNLAGVQVRLVDGAGHRLTLTSDALGNWEGEVPAGVVSMRVVAATVPAGYRLTTGNASQSVEAPPGFAVDTADVGYQPADGSLAGKVFFDVDGDGAQGPGEPAFAGVAVALYDGARLVRTVLTGSDGSYRFDDLPPGEFTVVVRDGADRFSGFQATLDPDGILDGQTDASLGVSEDRTGLDFAYRGTGTVGDTIWNDADGDEVQDPSEVPLTGIVVGLVWSGFDGVLGSADDVSFPSRATGAGGVYLFDGVPPGIVGVAVDGTSVDDDLEPTTTTSYDYDLGPGEDYLDGDIGYRARAELPNTGFDADRLGVLALGLIAVGLALLVLGRRGGRRNRLRWERLG